MLFITHSVTFSVKTSKYVIKSIKSLEIFFLKQYILKYKKTRAFVLCVFFYHMVYIKKIHDSLLIYVTCIIFFKEILLSNFFISD